MLMGTMARRLILASFSVSTHRGANRCRSLKSSKTCAFTCGRASGCEPERQVECVVRFQGGSAQPHQLGAGTVSSLCPSYRQMSLHRKRQTVATHVWL